MLIYSLRSHEVVKRLPFHNVSSFASSNIFTIIVSPKRHFFIQRITHKLRSRAQQTHLLFTFSLLHH